MTGKVRNRPMTAAQRRAKQALADKLHDGSFFVERMKPFDRIDWANRARDRTVGLFGQEFYQTRMRLRMAVDG